jgi:hypothetical protein
MMAWYRGNENAVQLSLDIYAVIQTWDDLIDRDNEVSNDDINETFRKLIYTIPTNPFYAAHAHELAPLFHDMMLQWMVANQMEADQKPGDLEKAWMLRAAVYQVFVYISSLAVDAAWAAVAGVDIWRSYGETLEQFIHEQQNREGKGDA